MVDSLYNRRALELSKRSEDMNDLDITIFVPCRNEQGNVGRALDAIVTTLATYPYSYEVIVVDDASTDETVSEVKAFMQKNPKVQIFLKENKIPRGAGYNFGGAAIAGRGKYFRWISGHFQDRHETIKNGFDYLGKADLIITYMEPDLRVHHRKWISRIYTAVVNLISGYKISHYHGTPIYRRMDVVRWHSYRSVGFFADLTTRLLDEGVSYIEVPTAVYQRDTGRSVALRWQNVISLMVGCCDMLLRRFSKPRIAPTKISIDTKKNV